MVSAKATAAKKSQDVTPRFNNPRSPRPEDNASKRTHPALSQLTPGHSTAAVIGRPCYTAKAANRLRFLVHRNASGKLRARGYLNAKLVLQTLIASFLYIFRMSAPVTPHAPTSARASLPPTGSATPALPPQPTGPTIPPPGDFDVVPAIHSLLVRFNKSNTQVHDPNAPTDKSNDDAINSQQLVTETTKLKRKIEKTRDAVMELPDIDRTIEDQQEEIEYLEARIAKLKATLQGLGQPASEAADEDTSMTG